MNEWQKTDQALPVQETAMLRKEQTKNAISTEGLIEKITVTYMVLNSHLIPIKIQISKSFIKSSLLHPILPTKKNGHVTMLHESIWSQE